MVTNEEEQDIDIDDLDVMKSEDEQLLEKLQEAPHVAYVDVYIKGFHVGRTFRDFSAARVDAAVERFIQTAINKGWMPSWNQDTNKSFDTKDETETRQCKKHDVPMEKKWSEKKQKHYFAHSGSQGICFGSGFN